MSTANQLTHFKKLLQVGNLAHGYLLWGEDSRGLKALVSDLANFLENQDNERAELVDSFFAGVDYKKSIGIETIREIKNFLSVKPVKSRRRLAAIFSADRLTEEAGNALLKISEDPPESALIMLTVKHEDNLPATLKSRFQKFYIASSENKKNPPSDHQNTEAEELAKRFLASSAKERSTIIKLLLEKEALNSEGLASLFVDNLILILSRNTRENAKFLGALLEKKRLLSQLSLNKRLQLEFLNSLWYNRKVSKLN